MSTQAISKKRKSAEGSGTVVKKAKVTKSADKPAPVKSSLKSTKAVEAAKKDANVPKPTTKKRVKETVVEDNDNEDGGAKLTPDQTAALLAGFSSSDSEEAGSEDEAGVSLSSLPKAPTTGALQKRITKATATQNDPETQPGVIYLGRIPHGFYEPQMRAYFSQFGTITHLKLARSKKTGASRHYAFIEFASSAVADIVAKTMDKYLLFNHILQARRLPQEHVREGMWKGTERRRKKPMPRNRLEGGRLRRGQTREEWGWRVEKEEKRREKKAEKLRELGYEFDMPGVKSVDEVPVREKVGVGAVEGEGAVELLENGNGEVVAEIETAQIPAEVEQEKADVPENAVSKKRPGHGKTQAKKVTKKLKT